MYILRASPNFTVLCFRGSIQQTYCLLNGCKQKLSGLSNSGGLRLSELQLDRAEPGTMPVNSSAAQSCGPARGSFKAFSSALSGFRLRMYPYICFYFKFTLYLELEQTKSFLNCYLIDCVFQPKKL